MPKTSPSSRSKKISAIKEGKEKPFPIVAIGASAGGLQAVSQLLKNLPADTGMAFIYVQHLSPDHPSNLASLLSGSTEMKVKEVKNMLKIEPDNVYVCTPNKEIILIGGKIKLKTRRAHSVPYLPIDDFFTSLTKNYKENIIGIILSGNAADGTQGLKAIKDGGGLTFAQDNSAKYRSMPKSAVDAGAADFVLSPEGIARQLSQLSKNDLLILDIKRKGKETAFLSNERYLKIIFGLLYKETGVDFSRYKMATIKRRLHHRMLQCGVEALNKYAKLLVEKKKEVELLYKDLLINVTCFFRDPEVFKYLGATFLPKLLKSKNSDQTLRIWVPACSSGEEAYSIAMLITELQQNQKKRIPVQIFATDLSEEAIRDGRMGKYLPSDMGVVPKKFIKRFFTKTGDHYQISKEIREMCLFSTHNVLSDPPFLRMDLISCRNLLIYLDTPAQTKILATLHFVLNDSGYLILGKSESIGTSSQLFSPINNAFKIYSRKRTVVKTGIPVELPTNFPEATGYKKRIKYISRKSAITDSSELDKSIDSVLLSRYMPACAIINRDMEILLFRGSTSLYLSHPSGRASLNILKMIRPEFAFELRSAIQQAIQTKLPQHRSGIKMNSKISNEFDSISMEVSPLKIDWNEPLLLVVFTQSEKGAQYGPEKPSAPGTAKQERKIKKLVNELNGLRIEMNSVLESQDKAYEELQASNEEVVSTNEEFQTLNEELETSKEEIEATNEELISTNQELQMRNGLLAESYNYSEAVLATIHEPMIILDSNLRVKSANKSFYKKFRVNKEETEGLPLFELGNDQWNIPKLRKLLESILSKNVFFENFEVTHTFPGIGEKIMLLNANRIIQKTHGEQLILLAIEDISERATRQHYEKEYLKKNIRGHEKDKLELEKAVMRRTKQLNQQNIELESANKDLTAFTYVSSHDLQEPLRKIKNFASILLNEEEKKLSADGKKYLKRTYEVANQMQMLIEDLLIYSRTKNTERKFEKIHLNVILDEVKKDFKDIIREKKAKIKVGTLSETNIIRFQFKQLIQNLIGNSLKFSKTKTAPSITIKSEIVHGSKLNNEKLSPKINYCHIIYTDKGIGFDPKYNERVFEVFQRLHNYEKYKGTGIGLAICKRIVENHNGIISAKGTLNKGARFDIYLPTSPGWPAGQAGIPV